MAATRQLRSAVQRTNSGTISFPTSKSVSSTAGNSKKLDAKQVPAAPEATATATLSKPKTTKIVATKRKAETATSTTSASKKAKTTKQSYKIEPEIEKVKAERKPKKHAAKKAVVLGQDPFPDYAHPSLDECQTVHDLLTTAHGPAKQPASIPIASLIVSGCGEVPSVLDALIRTLLSANTNATNSNTAYQGLVRKFGKDESKGCVNWENVRTASLKDVFTAIEKGGLANVKSKSIKKILDEVYDDGSKSGAGLSLDYLHGMTDADAMAKLTSFGGIGVKTATCVLMFCLRRAAFPVDTHVFRISKLLGWVPTVESKREALEQTSMATPVSIDDEAEGDGDDLKHDKKEKAKRQPPVTRDTTFLHLDAKIPSELKYGLHQLLIRHGRHCPVCAASGGRKLGINQHGQPLVNVNKEVTVKREKEDGTFEKVKMKIEVKEEDGDSDNDIGAEIDASTEDNVVKEEGQGEKKYVPAGAAGGTGVRGGGLPDGGCILGDLIRWERLI